MPGNGAAGLADPASGVVVGPRGLTAVVCASPADADAIADRLGRYADSDATLGGIPLRDLPLDEVRRRILVAGNDARLFSGPLRTELDPGDRALRDRGDRAGRDRGDGVGGTDLLDRAVDNASARDIVEALPDGLDADVVGAGMEFSGGQRQRLRLARALMVDPDVLVLVEPTSAVDAHTEARIGRRLGANRADRATVVFTTSPILLDRADRVFYVAAGRVVAEGTHAELLGSEPAYAALVTRGEDS